MALILPGLVGNISLLELARLLHLGQLTAGTRHAILTLSVLFLVIYYFERRTGADPSRYASRNFLTDLVYGMFYRCGLYTIFIWSPLMNATESVFNLNLIHQVPTLVSVGVYVVARDFFCYWLHRLQHSTFLWKFHRIHHSQTRLTFVTESRFHVVDQLQYHIVAYIPLLVLLGIPPALWLPLDLAFELLIGTQHAQLNWRLGPLYPIVVGPAFHAIHHSTEPRHYNRNFGMLFSFWDYLFGTADDGRQRPETFGVEGWQVPESFLRHFVTPFREIYESVKNQTTSRLRARQDKVVS